jgi:deoxyhypusine synthase
VRRAGRRRRVTALEPGAAATVSQLLDRMAATAFQGRALGEALDLLRRIYHDPQVTVIVGLAGSLASAGQWKLITWMLRQGLIDVLVTTGANISEDLVDSYARGYLQMRGPEDDARLSRAGLNRYYDVIGYERDYLKVTRLIAAFLGELDGGRPLATRELLYRFGLWLKTRGIDSIVSAAAENQVPVYCPAIVDSAYGDAVLLREGAGRRPVFDEATDYVEFMGLAPHMKETAVVYIGGGVPKDFIQTLAVTSGLLPGGRRRGPRAATFRGRSERPYYPHKYALQITADSPQWGGSSGASLAEGVSWGKQMAAGTRVDCRCDATIALPLLVQALSEQRVSRRRRPFATLFTGGA